MSTPNPTSTPSTATLVEQTALTTIQQLLPVILAGVAAGTAASSPQAATIAALAPILVQLIQAGGAGAGELTQIITAMTTGIQTTQAQIDAAAAARGVTVP